MTNPVLRGIEDAAKGISAERQRLNETFEALRATARTFNPNAVLQDDGTITIDGEVPPSRRSTAFRAEPSSLQEEALRQEAASSTRLDKEGDGQTVAIPPQRQANGKRRAQLATLKEYFYAHPDTRITVGAAASIISDETEVALHMLRALCNANIVERDPDAYYHLAEVEQRKMDPQTAAQPSEQKPVAPPSRPAPGSQPTVPPVPAEPGRQSVVDGGDEGRRPTDPMPTRQESEQRKPEPKSPGAATPTTSGPTTPSAPTQPSTRRSPRASATGAAGVDDRGPAKSPKPRSEMRVQQREVEERLDSIVLWMQGNPKPVNAVTIARVLGDLEPATKARYAGDLRVLDERGVVKRTGKNTYDRVSNPDARGRASTEYVLANPKA